MMTLRPTRPSDHAAIEALLDRAFGLDRTSKAAYRLREGVQPVAELCCIAEENSVLKGTISYWPMIIDLDTGGAVDVLLLGPIAVEPAISGQGVGIQLMEETLEKARQQGHDLVILVGDLDYYGRIGFSRDGTAGLRLPGPVDQDRLLVKSLQGNEVNDLTGLIRGNRHDG